METIKVETQADLDKIPLDFKGEINIVGKLYIVKNYYPNAIINVSENAQISNVCGNAQIRYVYGNAQISNVSGNACILICSDNAKIQTLGQNIVSHSKKQDKIKLDLSSATTLVKFDDIEPNFEWYSKNFPTTKTEDNCVILYKTVHKIGNIYISDYDKKFEYIIGEKIKHNCSENTNKSCDVGLHVSHKMFAITFGIDWSDVALLELKVPIDKIVVSNDCNGKIRTSELEVLREVPKEEWYL